MTADLREALLDKAADLERQARMLRSMVKKLDEMGIDWSKPDTALINIINRALGVNEIIQIDQNK